MGERCPVLRAAAEAVAESLVSRTHLRNATLANALRSSLLAENADANQVAEAHCVAVRCAFADEVQCALSGLHGTCVEGAISGPVPPVRIEIRGTAGRLVFMRAFTVGSAPECDVQVCGDPTVLPLRFVMVPLPCGIVVADFWSRGGVPVNRQPAKDEHASALAPARSTARIAAHDERSIIRIGARTTITLGPPAKRRLSVGSLVPGTSAARGAARPGRASGAGELPAASAAKAQRFCEGSTSAESGASCASPRSRTSSESPSRLSSQQRLIQELIQELEVDRCS